MNFSGEPEIAVLREDTYPAEIVGSPILVSSENSGGENRLWSIVKLSGENSSSSSSYGIATQDNTDGAFVEIASFPPITTKSTSTSKRKDQHQNNNKMMKDENEEFTIISRKCFVDSEKNNTSSSDIFVIGIRHIDGVFIVANADTLHAAGTGSLGGGSIQCVLTSNNNDNNDSSDRVVCFCDHVDEDDGNNDDHEYDAKNVEFKKKIKSTDITQIIFQSPSTTKNNNNKNKKNNNSPIRVTSHVTIPEVEIIAATSTTITTNTSSNNNNNNYSSSSSSSVVAVSLANVGGVVELWNSNIVLNLSSTSSTSTSSASDNNNSKSLVLGRCTFDSSRVGEITTFASNSQESKSGRLFGCTTIGSCLVFDIISSSSSSSSPKSNNNFKVKLIKTMNISNIQITSAVCACSTIWFGDQLGNVKIWSLESLEELGTLDNNNDKNTKTTTTIKSKPKSSFVISMSQLEFRQSVGVLSLNSSSCSSSVQTIAVKQFVKPATNISLFDNNEQLALSRSNSQANSNSMMMEASTTSSIPAPTALLLSSETSRPNSPSSQIPFPATSNRGSKNNSPTPHQISNNRSPSIESTSSNISNSANNNSNNTATTTNMISFVRQLCKVLSQPSSAAASAAASPTSSSSDSKTKNVISQANSRKIVVPEKILRQCSESEYLEPALNSVATASAIVGHCLPSLDLQPSTLTQDVSSVCDIAVRLYRGDLRLRKVVEKLERESFQNSEKDNSNFSSTTPNTTTTTNCSEETCDKLVSVCKSLSSKHSKELEELQKQLEFSEKQKSDFETEMKMTKQLQNEKEAVQSILTNKKEKESVEEMKKQVEELQKKLEETNSEKLQLQEKNEELEKKIVVAASSNNVVSSTSTSPLVVKGSSENYHNNNNNSQMMIEKLQQEVRNKSNLVKHLMQLTNDNGRVIEEMRTHAIQRRDECVDLRRKIRELDTEKLNLSDGTVREIDNMLDTFTNPHSTSTSNLRSVVFMLQNLRQKLRPF